MIAYLLWPLTKVFQRKLFEPLLKKLRPKKPVRTSLARGLSVALWILVALIIIAALIWLIIPGDVAALLRSEKFFPAYFVQLRIAKLKGYTNPGQAAP